MKKLILIDGNSLSYRAFYATAKLNLLTTSSGQATNALYGMINMVYTVLNKYKPDHIMIAFDAKGKTFRHKKLDSYKGNRSKTPQELIDQLGLIKEFLKLMKIKTFEITGFEADDIIATLATQAGNDKDFQTLIISSDKDLYQLVNDKQKVKMFQNTVGMSKGNLINEKFIQEKFGLKVSQFKDFKSLIGDSSDNLKGVAGIGIKTATKLLQEYDNLNNIYDNLDKIKPSWSAKLEKGREAAFLTEEMVTLKTDMDLPFDLSDTEIDIKNIISEDLLQFVEKYEMYSFLRKLKKDFFSNLVPEFEETNNNLINSITQLNIRKPLTIYIELFTNNYHTSKLFKMIISDGIYNFIINDEKELVNNEMIKKIFEDETIEKYCFDHKKDLVFLKRFNINLINVVWDLSLSLYLINNDIGEEWLKISKYLNFKIIDDQLFYNKSEIKKINPDLNYVQLLVDKATIINQSQKNLYQKLEDENLMNLYQNIEMPLAPVLAEIEINGVLVDRQKFIDIKETTTKKVNQLTTEIYQLANQEFNINSPKQLKTVLFENLELTPYNKKQSTDKKSLSKIATQHKIIDKILQYRKSFKLLSTYIEGMFKYVDNNDMIHTIYQQNKASTGRLTSQFPNMQNIVQHQDEQRDLKKTFIAHQGCSLISLDYSQIELRLLAFLSNDLEMLKEFRDGVDIHRRTASKIFNKPISEISDLERSRAKTINFGLIYGQSEFALSEALNINFELAREFINKYFEQFPKIKEFKEDMINAAQKHLYSKTFLQRKRQLKDINSHSFMVRKAAERIAVNMPIQGTAADILKIALIKVANICKINKMKIIATIHDEIIIEVDDNYLKDLPKKIIEEMEENNFNIPLKVDYKIGKNWYQLK